MVGLILGAGAGSLLVVACFVERYDNFCPTKNATFESDIPVLDQLDQQEEDQHVR